MKFSNPKLQKQASQSSDPEISGRQGVDFHLGIRGNDSLTWDPKTATMAFESDGTIINCKLLEVDVTKGKSQLINEFISETAIDSSST